MELISFMILPIFIALADQSEVSIFNKRYSAIFAPGVYSTYYEQEAPQINSVEFLNLTTS